MIIFSNRRIGYSRSEIFHPSSRSCLLHSPFSVVAFACFCRCICLCSCYCSRRLMCQNNLLTLRLKQQTATPKCTTDKPAYFSGWPVVLMTPLVRCVQRRNQTACARKRTGRQAPQSKGARVNPAPGERRQRE